MNVCFLGVFLLRYLDLLLLRPFAFKISQTFCDLLIEGRLLRSLALLDPALSSCQRSVDKKDCFLIPTTLSSYISSSTLSLRVLIELCMIPPKTLTFYVRSFPDLLHIALLNPEILHDLFFLELVSSKNKVYF